jgi:putative Mg2+ transporter-C (MgtC) family protein
MEDIPFFPYLGTIVFRLMATVVLTGIIGWDRERFRKPAGLRTHVLVGVGSALIMLISVVTGPMVNGIFQMDPRIAANVITGIGFLGAGTILHYRDGMVSGLTTAASLWVVSAIGLAVGCGFYSGAIFTTLLAFLVLYFMNRLDDYIEGHLYHSLTIHAKATKHLTEYAKEILRDENVKIIRTEIQGITPSGKHIVIYFQSIPVKESKQIVLRIEKLAGVREVFFNS